MSVKAGYSTPMLHVAEVERSLRFYELLGFVTMDTDRCKPIGWARMHCDGGAVMFLRAEEPVDPSAQAFMLCMYTPDLTGLREQLLAAGVKVPPIRHPQYMPSGEISFADPDGYLILVSHWGKSDRRHGRSASERSLSTILDATASAADFRCFPSRKIAIICFPP